MLHWLFHVHRPSRVFRDAVGFYQVCLECTARLPASIEFEGTHSFRGESPAQTGTDRHFAEEQDAGEEDVATLLDREKTDS